MRRMVGLRVHQVSAVEVCEDGRGLRAVDAPGSALDSLMLPGCSKIPLAGPVKGSPARWRRYGGPDPGGHLGEKG